jgi:hypothetical protein
MISAFGVQHVISKGVAGEMADTFRAMSPARKTVAVGAPAVLIGGPVARAKVRAKLKPAPGTNGQPGAT